MYQRSRTDRPTRSILCPVEAEIGKGSLEYAQRISKNIENGTRAVPKSPRLLFSLMAVSFLARLLFARPNKEDP